MSFMPYKEHRGMQKQQPLPCAGRLDSSCQALKNKKMVRTEKHSEVCRNDGQRPDRGAEGGKDIDAFSHLPYRETIVPLPAELPFASQMASFRSRIKISTVVTVSRCHLVSDYAAYPDKGGRTVQAI